MTIADGRRVVVVAMFAAIVLSAAHTARAQSAEAETLFREGKRLLKEGDIAGACDKFEGSERLEPTAGTELNLADCREKLGQLATAWAMFVKAAATAKHSDTDGKREAEARRRAAALEPKLVHLRVVPGDARPPGLVIKRNGTAIDSELWNQRVPVDPGDYVVTAEAPGYEQWQTTVTVRGKDKKVEIPPLDRSAAKPGDDATDGNAHKSDGGDNQPPPPPPSRFTAQRKAGVVVASIGAVALGVGIVMGQIAQNRESQSDVQCPLLQCANSQGLALNQQARNDALYANVGFGAGAALVATGAVLFILGGPKTPVDVAVKATSHGGALVFGGTW